MTSITSALSNVRKLLPKVAALGGDGEVLATQELKLAFERGLITPPQRDVLARAVSDGGNKLKGIREYVSRYSQVYARADKNHDGKVDPQERKAAKAAYDTWIRLISNTTATKAAKDAAFKKPITTTFKYLNGGTREVAVWGIDPLLKRLIALTA